MIKNYLEKIFGRCHIKEKNLNITLPLYLRNYTYYTYSCYNCDFVFVEVIKDLNLKNYKKQYLIIEEYYKCPAVLVVNRLNTCQKQNLIENNIMFIEPGKQIFMPKLGIILSQAYKKETTQHIDCFTPFTQVVALYLLYSHEKSISSTNIMKATRLNSMAISRALNNLEAIKLINSITYGRKKIYQLAIDRNQFIDIIYKYSINPILKKIIINKKILTNNINKFETGYSALSQYTQINSDSLTYAISKKTYNLIKDKCHEYKELLIEDGNHFICEVWKYDPAIYAQNNIVDPFSLAKTFSNLNIDERTEGEIESLLRRL